MGTPANCKFPRYIVVHFPSQLPDAPGTRLVAVKGTSTTRDYYVDMDIYGTIHTVQFFDQRIMPLLHWLTTEVVEKMISQLRATSNNVTRSMVEFIKALRTFCYAGGSSASCHSTDSSSSDVMLLTGHSLGGAAAGMAASILGLDSLLFSAPG